MGADEKKLKHLGTPEDHISRQYTKRQLFAYSYNGQRCQTRPKLTDNWQILRLASTFARQLLLFSHLLQWNPRDAD